MYSCHSRYSCLSFISHKQKRFLRKTFRDFSPYNGLLWCPEFELPKCSLNAASNGSKGRRVLSSIAYWQYKCIAWMYCKSLWITASAKCKNVNVKCSIMFGYFQKKNTIYILFNLKRSSCLALCELCFFPVHDRLCWKTPISFSPPTSKSSYIAAEVLM